MKRPTYHSIAFLRAVAAFWVLAVHCMIWGGWYDGIPVPDAKIAVDLFMLLSGFLMVATADARADSEPLERGVGWTRFWMRRFFRIAPLYYLVLAIAIVWHDPFVGGYAALQRISPEHWAGWSVYDPASIHYTWTNVLLHVTFLSGLVPAYVDASYLPDWSLSLEMQFYLAFPGLLLLMRRYGVARSALTIGLPTILIGRIVASQIAYPEPSLLVFKLHCFLAGMLVYHAVTHDRPHLWRLLACALLLVACEWGYGWQLPLLLALVALLAWLAWHESTRCLPAWLARLLGSRAVAFASDASYSVYLLHGFGISAAGLLIERSAWLLSLSPPMRVLAMLLFVCFVVYPAAWLTYHLIEQPGMRIGARLLKQRG